MLNARSIATGTIVVLWALALWHSWECRGLYSDGAEFLLDMVVHGSFSAGPFDARAHAIVLTEAPVMLAMKLGVVDLHWLARLYSLGLFGVPTALYSVALLRARRDVLVLAVTILAVATIFMTTSFLIIGEYNTAYAVAILAAVWLGTASELSAADGAALVAIAILGTRCYQHYVYLGPLLGSMTLWTIFRASSRPPLATALYGIAVALFLCGMVIAAVSLVDLYGIGEERRYVASVLVDASRFRFNLQLDLLLLATASLAAWGLIRPDDFRRPWPYLAGGLFVLLLALSPALVFVNALVAPPYSSPQKLSRTLAGPLTAGVVLFMWFCSSGYRTRLPLLGILKRRPAAGRLLALASALLVATMPWDIMLTLLYARYLEVVRSTIRAHGGLIEMESSILELHPRLAHDDSAATAVSLIMRTSPSDGLIVWSERDRGVFLDFDPKSLPDLGRFVWRD